MVLSERWPEIFWPNPVRKSVLRGERHIDHMNSTKTATAKPTERQHVKPPMLFDDHTDEDVVELYYLIDSRLGRNTCKAACEFCWLKRPHLSEFKQDVDVARRMIGLLRGQGYKVSPMVSDTFAENGLYLKAGFFKNERDPWNGGSGNNGFYGGHLGNAAWSSGRPLLDDNGSDYLQLCVENNIRSIVMTSHGTEDREREFRGLTQPSVVREAIRRIQAFSEETGWAFQIMLTFTLNRTNNSADQLHRYLDYCANLGVKVARFNRFADIQGTYPELRMSKDDVVRTYQTLKEVHHASTGEVQMSVSEDFGSWGGDVMGFPQGVGHCVAGERLFGVVYPYVYVCPVNLTVVAGIIDSNGVINWDAGVAARLAKAKEHEHFGGCMGVAYPHHKEIRDIFRGTLRHSMPPAPARIEPRNRSHHHLLAGQPA